MSKDPAFLFYPDGWLGGTLTLTRYEKGAYMDLLMAQFNGGHLTIEQIRNVLGEKDQYLWGCLSKKFVQDEQGLFYNKKLESEMNKKNVKKVSPYNPLPKEKILINNTNTTYNNIYYILAEELLNNILYNKPDFKKPNLELWSKDISCLVRLDKRDPKEILMVIRWCQKNSFWKNNILSADKLRKQYDQLVMKMNAEKKPVIPPTQSPYEVCRRCGNEFRRGEQITLNGKLVCPKCPEAKKSEQDNLKKLGNLFTGIKSMPDVPDFEK